MRLVMPRLGFFAARGSKRITRGELDSAPGGEAEDFRAIRTLWSGRAEMTASVGVIPVSLNFLRRDTKPLPVFTASGKPDASFVAGFGRVAVVLITTRQAGVIRPHPGRVKLLVDWLVLRRVLVLRTRADSSGQKSGGHQDHNAAPSAHGRRSGHAPGTTGMKPPRQSNTVTAGEK